MHNFHIFLLCISLNCFFSPNILTTNAGPTEAPRIEVTDVGNETVESQGVGSAVNGSADFAPRMTVVEANNETDVVSNNNSTSSNGSDSVSDVSRVKTWKNFLHSNQGALQRTFYVLIGVSALIILYFIVKAFRVKRKRNKSRKYGVITTNKESALEMEPLDNSEEEDEDEVTTLFEANNHRRHR